MLVSPSENAPFLTSEQEVCRGLKSAPLLLPVRQEVTSLAKIISYDQKSPATPKRACFSQKTVFLDVEVQIGMPCNHRMPKIQWEGCRWNEAHVSNPTHCLGPVAGVKWASCQSGERVCVWGEGGCLKVLVLPFLEVWDLEPSRQEIPWASHRLRSQKSHDHVSGPWPVR